MCKHELLPLPTLAARLGLRPKDVRLAAEHGDIPCIRVGERGLLFDMEAAERALLKRAGGETSDPQPARKEVSDAP